jgi:putative SOS response-associated peptidase YedK
MCNRYSAARKEQIRQLAFEITGGEISEDWRVSYNIPVRSLVPVVVKATERPARLLQWGTESKMGFLFNARGETLAEKPTWREAVARRRCLLLADGFFEFETVGRTKVGHYFSVPACAVFCIAGLWLPATPDQPDRCVMVTNAPNPLVAPLHDRMPTILDSAEAREWLGDEPLPAETMARLTQPYPAAQMAEWRSPPEMNSHAFQEPAAIEPWRPEPDLFG